MIQPDSTRMHAGCGRLQAAPAAQVASRAVHPHLRLLAAAPQRQAPHEGCPAQVGQAQRQWRMRQMGQTQEWLETGGHVQLLAVLMDGLP